MEGIIWLVALALLLVIEIATLGLTTIWFACGSLIAFLASLLGLPVAVQVVLFVIVSAVLLVFTRPLAVKHLNSKTTKTNAESLVGRSARVSMAIDNIKPEGQVIVNGLEWTARSADDEIRIPAGKIVQIVGIQGVKLIVKEKKE